MRSSLHRMAADGCVGGVVVRAVASQGAFCLILCTYACRCVRQHRAGYTLRVQCLFVIRTLRLVCLVFGRRKGPMWYHLTGPQRSKKECRGHAEMPIAVTKPPPLQEASSCIDECCPGRQCCCKEGAQGGACAHCVRWRRQYKKKEGPATVYCYSYCY